MTLVKVKTPYKVKVYISVHTQRADTHHGLLVFIGFDAADKERLTDAECPHQQLQRSFKLTAQSGRALPGLCPLTEKHRKCQGQKKMSTFFFCCFFLSSDTNVFPVSLKIKVLVWMTVQGQCDVCCRRRDTDTVTSTSRSVNE